MNRTIEITKGQVFRRNQGRAPIKYFFPGQFILQAEHPNGVSRGDLVKVATDFFEHNKEGQQLRIPIKQPKEQSVVTFPQREESDLTFSLIPIHLTEREVSDEKLVEYYKKITSRLPNSNLPTLKNIVLRTACLNWIAGGAHGQSGTGGPGGWPTEAGFPLEGSWGYQFYDQQNSISQLPFVKGRGKGMHVAILDTMPSVHAMGKAYSEWHWHHPLIESLLRPGGPLCVYPASHEELVHTEGYDLMGHRYLMRDHGLFIAGIIHSIAPEATLHLYEVLNPYGVGSLETITRGLQKVLENPVIKQGEALIINCSFMLGIPVKRGDTYIWEFDPEFPVEFRDPGMIEQMGNSTKEIFDTLANRENTVIVAAAGNDARNDKSTATNIRPDTRYPAASPNVIGVGALPKILPQTAPPYEAATYSNLSDDPTPESYITLGGEPGRERGVLGVYIGEFPDYGESLGCLGLLWRFLSFIRKPQPGYLPKNKYDVRSDRIRYRRNLNGWAWWAGTSFATPIVSGMLAANQSLPANQGTDFNKEKAESFLDTTRQSRATPQDEKVILVSQG